MTALIQQHYTQCINLQYRTTRFKLLAEQEKKKQQQQQHIAHLKQDALVFVLLNTRHYPTAYPVCLYLSGLESAQSKMALFSVVKSGDFPQ